MLKFLDDKYQYIFDLMFDKGFDIMIDFDRYTNEYIISKQGIIKNDERCFTLVAIGNRYSYDGQIAAAIHDDFYENNELYREQYDEGVVRDVHRFLINENPNNGSSLYHNLAQEWFIKDLREQMQFNLRDNIIDGIK